MNDCYPGPVLRRVVKFPLRWVCVSRGATHGPTRAARGAEEPRVPARAVFFALHGSSKLTGLSKNSRGNSNLQKAPIFHAGASPSALPVH